MQLNFIHAPCALGTILLAQKGQGVCAVLLGDGPEAVLGELRQRFPSFDLEQDSTGLDAPLAMTLAYLRDPHQPLSFALDLAGTDFQTRVWQEMTRLRVGETLSYGALAARIGTAKAVRAVAGACAANTLALAVPCHRILRADQQISGFRWGVGRKNWLLAHERAAPASS